MKRGVYGFTLIELIVVITIIGILAAVVTLQISNKPIIKARDNVRKTDINSIADAYMAQAVGKNLYEPLTSSELIFGKIPTPPEGGSYQGLLTEAQSYFLICAQLEYGRYINCLGNTDNPNCYCRSSGSGVGSGPLTSTAVPTPVPTPSSYSDLDVVYISRNPRYQRYSICYSNNLPYVCAGTENLQRWPSDGDPVTFKASVINKGEPLSGGFVYQWFIDDVLVQSGTYTNVVAKNEVLLFTNTWNWASGNHRVRFKVVPFRTEFISINNQLEDYTNALSFKIHVENSVYNAFNNTQNVAGSKSFEDWVQYQVRQINEKMVQAGGSQKVRIDEIAVELDNSLPEGFEHAPLDMDWDGRWGFGVPEWITNNSDSIATWASRVQWGLVHELGHQIGLIDGYNLNYDWNYIKSNYAIPVCASFPGGDAAGTVWEKCMYYSPNVEGIMSNMDSGRYVAFESQALNSNLGKRRGFFGEYLYDIPDNNTVLILDLSTLQPVVSAQLSFYQTSGGNSVPNIVVFSGITDDNGRFTLPNRAVTSFTTATGHTLKNNPFGQINVVGQNGTFLIKVEKGGNTGYAWLDISSFNLAYWAGQTQSAEYNVKVAMLAPTPTPAPSPVGFANKALSKPASSNRADYVGGHDPVKAVDGNKSTSGNSWQVLNPLRSGDYIQVDLGSSFNLSDIKVYPNSVNYSDMCDSFRIDVSANSSMAGSARVGQTSSAPHTQVIDFPFAAVSGRYVRLTCDNDQNWVQLQELEIYGY